MTEAELRKHAQHRFVVVASHAVKILDAKDAEIARLQDVMRSALDELANGSEAEAYLVLLQHAARSFPPTQETEA